MNLDPSKEIDYYWFSGTGNTLTVVRRMKDEFEKNGFTVNLKPIEKSDPADIDCGKTIGFGIPVAEQGTYPFIWDFIKGLPECSGTRVFFVDTMMAYSGGIIGPVGKILKRKGYILTGAREIKMPHNFFVRSSGSGKNSEKLNKGLAAAEKFAAELVKGNPVWRDLPVYSDIMSSFSRAEFTWKFFRRFIPLKVDHDICTRCRLCEKLCPVDNWTLNTEKNRMEWRSECVFCMRCFSYCPVNAIHYGSKKNLQYNPLKASDFLS